MLDGNNHTWTIIAALVVLGASFIAAMLYAVHRARDSMDETARLQWLAVFGIVALCALMFTGSKPEPTIAPLDRALITVPPQPVIVNLADCPDDTPGMTGQIVMTIETRSDLAPLVTGCTRIAERQYIPSQAKATP